MLPGTLAGLRGPFCLRLASACNHRPASTNDYYNTIFYSFKRFLTFSWKKDLEIPKNQYTKWFDYDKIDNTLSVRTRETGDYYMIGDGKRKLLKRFFIDEKIPEAVRGEIPLLADGNHILWIIGHRISEYYKITLIQFH